MSKDWIHIPLKEVVLSKKGKKPKRLEEEEFEGSVPYLDIKAFEKDEIRRYADIESSNIIDTNSVGVVWDGARSGWVTKGKYGAIGSTIAKLTPIVVEVDYLYWFIKSHFQELNTNTKGTGIPHVKPEVIWNLQFPLSPLNEQKRIVKKLDAIFEKINQNKARLERIPQLLKDFRQQVLQAAVTGELTRSNQENWEISTIEDLCDCVSGNAFKSKDFAEVGYQVVRMGNLYNGELDLTRKPVFLPKEKINEKEEKYFIRANSILLSLTGTKGKRDYGFPVVITEIEEQLLLNQRILMITPKKIELKFLSYLMTQSRFRDDFFRNETGSANQGNVGVTSVKKIEIKFPLLDEQKEIVSKVEELFAFADKIEANYHKAKTKIEQLPQTILAKAFKGELVKQDPNDEPASELLAKIKETKKALKKKKK